MSQLTRRRFISITALAGVGCAALPQILAAKPYTPALYRWNGVAMGANASMQIYGVGEAEAAILTQRCIAEITRLEQMFSLYEPASLIQRLNAEGHIQQPPAEFVALLQRAKQFGALTGGAFDITVQPLWKARKAGEQRAVDAARALVNYQALQVSDAAVFFEKKGMAITLNGIAQGYITDQVVALLKAQGIENTLVNMGELRAIGSHPDGRPWQVGVRQSSQGDMQAVPLDNRAISTSANIGSMLNLIHPATGEVSTYYDSLSVIAPDATTADALSTGLFHLPPHRMQAVTAPLKDIQVIAATL